MSYHPGVQVLGGTCGCFCCASRTRVLIKSMMPWCHYSGPWAATGAMRQFALACSAARSALLGKGCAGTHARSACCNITCTPIHILRRSGIAARWLMRLTMQLTIRWCRVHGSRFCPWPARLGINHSSATLANGGPVVICVFAIFTDTASGWLRVDQSAAPLSLAEAQQPSSRCSNRSTAMVSDSQRTVDVHASRRRLEVTAFVTGGHRRGP